MRPWHQWSGLFLAVLLLTGCQQSSENQDTVDEETSEEEEIAAIPVEIASSTRSDIYATYSGTAPIEAFADATVIAKVSGEVREIFVEEGDRVKAGQILARLDGDRLRLEQTQTEANLRKLQQDYKRNIDLNDRGLISEGDFEKIKFEMDSLEATNDLAKLQLSYADIRTPIDGVVSERFIKLGNTVDIEAATFQVTSMEPLVSYLHVPEREFRRISSGKDAVLMIDALAGDTFPAKVKRVSPTVDPVTGTFKITIEVSDASRRLKPGMFARITIIQDIHVDALQVPRSVLIDEIGVMSIFVVEGDIAHRRIVQTGLSSKGRVEITAGLLDDEKFVAVGQGGLKDGSRVSIINGADAVESTASNSD